MKKIDKHGIVVERTPLLIKGSKTCCPETLTVEVEGCRIVVELTGDGSGSITSDLHEDEATDAGLAERCLREAYNHGIDAIESLVLAHALAGIDIKSPAYVEGLGTALNAVAEQHS